MKAIPTILLALILISSAAPAQVNWRDDVDQALKLAKADGKLVLVQVLDSV